MRLIVGGLFILSEFLILACLFMLLGHWGGFLAGVSNVAVTGAFTFYIPVADVVSSWFGLAVGLMFASIVSRLRRILG